MYHVVRSQHRSYAFLVVVLFSAALLFLLGGTSGRFTANQFKIAVRDIHSDIETARLTIEQARSENVTHRYTTEEIRSVLDDLSRTLREIQLAQADESLEPNLREAGRIAEDAADILRRIANAPGDESPALDSHLGELAAAARELADRP